MEAKDLVICADINCNWVYSATYKKCPRCGQTKRVRLIEVMKNIKTNEQKPRRKKNEKNN